MNGGWGDGARHDYWTALAAGQVDVPERRAMELLEFVCDPYRFSIYCHTGEMPARGNLTGTIFLVRRRGRVGELEDGVEIASWCISIGPHAGVPGTDNVVVLKAMLEGEEAEFRRIGNRSSYWRQRKSTSFVNPYAVPFVPEELRSLYPTVVFGNPNPLETERELENLEMIEMGVVDLALSRATHQHREALDRFQRSHRRRRSAEYTGPNHGYATAQAGMGAYLQPAGADDGIAQDLRERIAEQVRAEVGQVEWVDEQDLLDRHLGPDGELWQEPWWDRQPGAIQYLNPLQDPDVGEFGHYIQDGQHVVDPGIAYAPRQPVLRWNPAIGGHQPL